MYVYSWFIVLTESLLTVRLAVSEIKPVQSLTDSQTDRIVNYSTSRCACTRGLIIKHNNYKKFVSTLIRPLFQDRRLHLLSTSIRGAMRCGFTNGKSKTVMYDIVALVRQNCLCDKHNLRLNVYVRVFSGMYCPLYNLVHIYITPKNLAQVHIVRTIVVAWLLKSMSTPKCLLTPRTQTAGQVVPSHLTALS